MGLGSRDADAALGTQALAIAVSVLAVFLAVRIAYRTIRSTVALAFWLVKWGAILYAVLLAYLWYTHETPTATQQALAGVNAVISASASTFYALALRTLQQPGGVGAVAQQLASAFDAPRTAPRRTQRRKQRQRRKDDVLGDLADSLGLGDVLGAAQAWDPAANAGQVKQEARKKRKRSRFWD